jgi:hypothetical protein
MFSTEVKKQICALTKIAKNLITKSTFVTFVAAAAFLLTINPESQAADGPERDSEQLVGSWSGTFTPAPGDPSQFPPLPALFSFSDDGIMTETDGGSLASPSAQPFSYGSPGHGGWRKSGERHFAVKFLLLAVNMDGTIQVTGTVTLKITVDRLGNAFHGTGHYEFALPDGTIVAAGDELIEAKRIKV